MTDVTLSENARVNLPLLAIWSGAVAVILATGGAVATYFGLRAQIGTIGQAVASIEKEIGKIADRVDAGPTRREFDLALERLRYLEAKAKE